MSADQERRSGKLARGARHSKQDATRPELDENIGDGPFPWWSGLVWYPVLILAIVVYAGLFYALWQVL